MGNKLEKYLFIRPLLRLLEKGGFFTRMVGTMLRVLAALIVLGSLAAIFKAGKVMFELPASGIMGGIMYQLCYILAIYAVVHTIIIRSQDIEALGSTEQFVLPVASYLVRLVGEIYAFYMVATAIGGGIFIWFTGQTLNKIMSWVPYLYPMPRQPDFMGGIELIVLAILIATASIILTYILAELVSALAVATKSKQLPVSGNGVGPRRITEHRTGNQTNPSRMV